MKESVEQSMSNSTNIEHDSRDIGVKEDLMSIINENKEEDLQEIFVDVCLNDVGKNTLPLGPLGRKDDSVQLPKQPTWKRVSRDGMSKRKREGKNAG